MVPQALDEHDNMLGVVISKLEPHRGGPMRGYIAMLAVKKEHRGRGIATKLVRMAIDVMIERDADEVRSNPLRSCNGGNGRSEAGRLLSRQKSPTPQP